MDGERRIGQKKILGIMTVENLLQVGAMLFALYFAQDRINRNMETNTVMMKYRLDKMEDATKDTQDSLYDIQRRLARKGI